MLKRTAPKLGSILIFALAALLASCGPGETSGAFPDQESGKPSPDKELGPSDDATAADVDASLSARDAEGLDASSASVPQSAEATGVLAQLRERFIVKIAAEPAETAPSEEQLDASLAAPVLTPLLGASVANGFESGPAGIVPHFSRAGPAPSPARVQLSQNAKSPFRIEDATTGVAVEATLLEGRDAAAQAVEGYLVYPHGHASGATILHRALPEGTEDYLSFDNRPARPVVSYEMKLAKGVSGLRLVANSLEMLDSGGAPRLRVSPPSLMGADGSQVDATLSVEGCAVDRDPTPPWGRSIVPPGAKSCRVALTWQDEKVAYPALLDPKWSTTGSMATARQGHTSTLLSNGLVLVTGGTSNGSAGLATAELYDRTTGTWAGTGSMTGTEAARWRHTASQLATSSNTTTSGKVLIAGGLNGSSSTSTTQLYSPTAGTFIAGADMGTPRNSHTATVLANGGILVTGGMGGTTVFNTATVFTPASSGTGTWNSTPNMASKRRWHTATLLTTPSNATLNNKVLVVGGNSGSTTSVTSVQLFDPGSTSWSTLTALSTAREGQTATVMSDGKVLFTGGKSGTTTLDTALLFNPATGSGTWTAAGTMTTARQLHTATLLSTSIVNNGRVVVAGGSSNGTTSLTSAELFDGTSTWTTTTALAAATHAHTATLLGNGLVLIAGGLNGSTTVSASELYDPSSGIACTNASQCVSGFCANGMCCNNACTDECSACNLAGLQGTCSPKTSGTACTDDGNACTVDQCDGTNPTCQHPAGNAGVTCRASTGTCDTAEICTGASTSCPADGQAPEGTSCSDGNACNGAEICNGSGVCTTGTLVVCTAIDQCHGAGTCDPVTGACSSPPQPCNDSSVPAPVLFSASFHQSPVRGEPDDVLLLAGSGLSSTDRVVYKELTNTTQPLVAPTSVPTASTVSEGLATVVQVPNEGGRLDSLTVILPSAITSGSSYALWVVTADSQWSNGAKINDARPLWISPDIGYVSASWATLPRQLKVIGRNLRSKPGSQTIVRLASAAATFTLNAADDGDPITTIEEYAAKVSLPSSMPAGEYVVSVQRDGASWVDLIGQRFTVVADPAPKPDFLVSSAGACAADDDLDDTACLAAAIAAAAANPGGGTVVFGAGRWDLLSPNNLSTPWFGIVIPKNVDLRGSAGGVPSKVKVGAAWNVDANGSSVTRPAFSVLGKNQIKNLQFEDSRPLGPDFHGFFSMGRPSVDEQVLDQVVFANNVFANPYIGIIDNASNVPIEHLFVVNNVFGAYVAAIRFMDNWYVPRNDFRLTDSVITGNTFKPGSYLDVCGHQGTSGTELGASSHLDFSGNVFDGHATDYLGQQSAQGWQGGSLFPVVRNHEMTLVSQNTYTCTGKVGAGMAIFYGPNDATGFSVPKSAAAATANSVTVSTSDGNGLLAQQRNTPVPVDSYYVGHWVQIANGRGLGQARKITSYTIDANAQTVTFVMSPNWDVAPDTSSVLVVVGMAWQAYTVDNTIDNTGCTTPNQNGIKAPGGINLAGQVIDSVVEGNLQRASGGITFAPFYSVDFTFQGTFYAHAQMFQSFVDVQRNRILQEMEYDSHCSTGGIGLFCGAAPGTDLSNLPASPVVLAYGLAFARNQITHADSLRGGALSFAPTWYAPNGSRLYLNTLIHHNTFSDLTAPESTGTTTTSLCPAEGTTNCGDDPVREVGVNITQPVFHSTVLYKNTLTNVTTALVDHGTNTVKCPTADTCSTTACGAPTDDGNLCTKDSCDPSTGLPRHDPELEGTSCSDSNACNGAETCNSSGVCVAGTPVNCAVADQCHDAGTCDPATGLCPNPRPNGAVCNDGSACTRGDVCQASLCTGTAVPGCGAKIPVEDLGTLVGGTRSNAWGINDAGVAVGWSWDAGGAYRIVRWRPGSAIEMLGPAYAGAAVGINSSGVVVGSIFGGSAFRYSDAAGFLMVSPQGLSEYGGAINELNSVVATSATQASRYTDAHGHQLLGILPGGNRSYAGAIDDQDNVVGWAAVATTPAGDQWNPGHAFRYNNATSQLQDLNVYAPIGWELRTARAVNGNEIVGFASHESMVHAYRLTLSPQRVDDLGTFEGGGISYPLGINKNGAVAGAAYLDGTGAGNNRAAVFTEQLGAVNLDNTVDPADGWVLVEATALNNNGDVVGWGFHNGNLHAFKMHVPGLNPARVPRCQNNAQCGTGFCSPQGVCCDTACTSVCSSCMNPGKVGTCSPRAAGSRCSAASICDTGGDVCDANGACVPGSGPIDTNDNNPCTIDTCDPSTGAKHAPNVGASCSDGNACNGAETCDANGACTAGLPVNCGVPDACHLAATCNPATGACVFPPAPQGTDCGDGNPCNGIELCDGAGACVTSGGPPTPDDGNPCTIDSCDGVTGLPVHTPVDPGAPCDDLCLIGGVGTCDGSTCTGGTAVTCTASDICHAVGTCNPSTGLCSDPPLADGTLCGDGTACTTGDTCMGGTCTRSPSRPCTAECPCPGTPCAADSDCPAGLVCGENNAACFSRVPRGTRVCWEPRCAGEGNRLACGEADSACGSNCDCVNPCDTTDPGTTCPTGEVCKARMGQLFNASVPDLCVDPRCPSNDPNLCGRPNALCGKSCICTPNCASATCANPADGCGGLCPAVCGPGSTGCSDDVTCPVGQVCLPSSDGIRTCRPGDCAFRVLAPPLCGTPGAPCGDQCPACTPQCEGRQCGPDPNCGQSCGTCGGPGMFCNGAGQCQAPTVGRPVGVPDGNGGSHPVVIVPPGPPSHVGALAGGFSVSEQGTSQYTIPIEVPPGRAGIQPALALTYGGSRENGDVGVGWHLEGLSRITRCPKSQALDFYPGPVRNNVLGNDRFCIDGKRLEAVAGVSGGAAGAYGEDGTEYRTLIDTFARIVSYQGGAGVQLDPWSGVAQVDRSLQGPDFFRVWTKDGRILTYGGNRDGTILARNGTRYSWLLTRVEDRAGNSMSIEYTNLAATLPVALSSGAENVIRPRVISYTGHGSAVGNRQVEFAYEERNDPQHKFLQGGIPLVAELRLSRIITAIDGVAIKNYHLVYASGALSKVTQISECTGRTDADCKNPTQFDYVEESGFTRGQSPGIDDTAARLDANGDGISDYLTTKVTVHPVDPDPWLAAAEIVADVAVAVATSTLSAGVAIPVNVMWAASSPSFFGMLGKSPRVTIERKMYLGSGNRDDHPMRFAGLAPGIPCSGQDGAWILDYDQDGKDDVLVACPTNDPLRTGALDIKVAFSMGNGQFQTDGTAVASLSGYSSASPSSPPTPVFVDLNGDSLQDLLYCKDSSTLAFRRRLGPTQGFATTPLEISTFWCTGWFPTFNIFDIDGDGTPDFLLNATEGWQVLRYQSLSGQGSTRQESLVLEKVDLPNVGTSAAGENMTLGDINGDGLLDIYKSDNYGVAYIWLNGGNNRFASRTTNRPIPANEPQNNPDVSHQYSFTKQALLDYNADGLTDSVELWEKPVEGAAHFFNVALIPTSSFTNQRATTYPVLLWPLGGTTNSTLPVPAGFKFAGDIDGDGDVDLYGMRDAFYGSGRHNLLLKRVVDGAGRVTNVSYDDLPAAAPDQRVYRTDDSCGASWPETCVKRLSGLVRSIEEGYVNSAGIDNIERSSEYHYLNARMNVTGEGWIGFDRRIVRAFVGGNLSQEVTTEFEPVARYTPSGQLITSTATLTPPYLYPLAGLPKTVTVDEYPNTGIGGGDPSGARPDIEGGSYIRRSRIENVWQVRQSAFNRPFPFAQVRNTQSFDRGSNPPPPFEIDGTPLTTCSETRESDDYGNVKSNLERCQFDTEMYPEEMVTITEIVPNTATWSVANPTHVTRTSNRGGEHATQEWAFRYNPGNDLLESVTRAPGTAAQHTTTYVRDAGGYGNVSEIHEQVVSGEDDRITTIGYDPNDNIFPETIANAKNQVTQVRFDARWGAPTITADPNGIFTARAYDDFGRLVRGDGPEGTTFVTYADALSASIGHVQNVQVTIESQGTGGSRSGSTARVYDHRGLLLSSRTEGFAGAQIFEERTYDALGRLFTRTLPHTASTNPPPTETYSYDRLHHVKRIDHPDGKFRQFQYASKATLGSEFGQWLNGMPCGGSTSGCPVDFLRTTDEEGRESVAITDHHGLVVRSIDGDNVETTELSSNYTYGPFNRLRRARDNIGHTTEFIADAYGRRTSVIDPDTGASASAYNGFDELTSTTDPKAQTRIYHYDGLGRIEHIDEPGGAATQWIYDQGPNGVGHLSETISPPTPENPSGNHVVYSYEPTTTTAARGFLQQIDTTLDGTTYTATFGYDDAGRIDTIHYPDLGTGAPIVAKYLRDTSGVLTGVDEIGGAAPKTMWRMNEAFEGHLVSRETFGNGASTQYLYNPQRHWLASLQTTIDIGVVQSLEYARFNNGLVQARTTNRGRREYTYDNLNRLSTAIDAVSGGTQTTSYGYDAIGNITTRGNTTLTYHDTQPHLLLGVTGNAYGYDANGNVALRGGPDIPGGEQSFEYTPFDLPRAISTGSGPSARTTQFEYTADETRVIRRDADTTRYFVNGIYQRVVTTGTTSTVEERFSLHAGGRQLGEIVRTNGSDETLYFHTDEQGSVDTVTTNGQGFYAQDFESFGTPIDPPLPEITRAGFTGHQHDNDLGLIDMKGRIYDQFAARFTSADPVMQAPFSTQGLNRYSYVFNDPVNNVDPSGFAGRGLGDSDVQQMIGGIALTAWLPGWSYGSGLGFANAAVHGIMGGLGGAREGSVAAVTPQATVGSKGPGGSMHAWGQNSDGILGSQGGDSLLAKEPGDDWNSDGSKNILPGEACMAEDCTKLYYIPLIEMPDSFWVVRALVREAAAQAWKQIGKVFTKGEPAAPKLQRPSWVRDDSTFVNWMKNLERDRPNLSRQDLDELVGLARQYGVKIRALSEDLAGHPGTQWPGPHIHFGELEVHVPAPPGYTLPP